MRLPTFILLALLAVSATFAQVVSIPAGGGNSGGFIEYQDHASTAFEGATRGMGALIRSGADANLTNSEAALNMSVVRRNEIDNQKHFTQTYFDMRRINREARAAERTPRGTREDFIRYAQDGAPKRLSPSDLNVVTGQITWPSVLQDPVFQENRTNLNNFFAYRAKHGTIDFRNTMKAQGMVDDMQAELKKNIAKIPSQFYSPARNFLDSL